MAASGESPQLLGGLIRAYANLAMLSEGLWNPSFRVYAARALLYAQRWHVREPESAAALWHLAYAEAICGLHSLAIENLDQAAKIQASAPQSDRISAPSWVPLIRAAVYYTPKPLRDAIDSNTQSQLAALLLILQYDQSAVPGLVVQVLEKVRPKIPLCYRLYDEPTEHYGTNLVDDATSQARKSLRRIFTARSPRFRGCLPPWPRSPHSELIR